MNIYHLALQGHSLSRGINPQYLDDKSKDHRCFGEHEMLGSTTLEVRRPWVPYALLAGRMSIEECNAHRKEHEEIGAGAVPIFFGLSNDYIIFVSLGLVNPKTLEVPLPRIIKVLNRIDGSKVPNEEELKRNPYRGPYWNVREIK